MMPESGKRTSVPLNRVCIDYDFWSQYIKLVHNEVIPYPWEAINDRISDAKLSHEIKNFRIAAGLEKDEFYGFVFQDTDVAKWLEAVTYCLWGNHNPGEMQVWLCRNR